MTLLPVLLAVTVLAQAPQKVTISLTGGQLSYLHSTPPEKKVPLVVALPPDTSEQLVMQTFRTWEKIGGASGWVVVTPAVAGVGDLATKGLDLILDDIFQRLPVDTSRVYLAGAGTPDVFYYVSRLPDRFAAALSIQGNPTAALNSNRLFGANTQLCPLLWVDPPAAFEMQRSKLAAAGFRLEARSALKDAQVLEWLAGHKRDPNPSSIDCETGNPAFARCHWIEMTRFNPKLRNDVLTSTRVNPGSGASLALGGFGYDSGAQGPGARVVWLPDDYHGQLQRDDRIVAIGGAAIKDGAEYARFMDKVVEEKPVALTVERAGKRLRIETRFVLPKREETVTARVQARYSAEEKEILIISRTVSQMRINVPAEWAGAAISWNGSSLGQAASAGCWVLDGEKEPPSAIPCQK